MNKPADPIDLVASAIAGRLALVLAAELAVALRRVIAKPALLPQRSDTTAAERQRRHRRAAEAAGREPGATTKNRATKRKRG